MIRLVGWFLTVLLGTSLLVGCEERRVIRRNVAQTQTETTQNLGSSRQFVDQALAYLDDLHRFPAEQVQAEVLQRLNRWLIAQPYDPQWQPDPLVGELPAEMQAYARLQDLATRRFLDVPESIRNVTFRGSEFDYLVGEHWNKTISDWIRQNKVPPAPIQEFLDLQDTLTRGQRQDLGLAYLLFDWTVRHIHPVRKTGTERERFAPGTSRDVWASLQINEGDALERARVFIHLCRQQGLEAVVVQFGQETPVVQVVGVAIGQELFLFDMAYGLPIATADGSGIQSLSHLVANPDDVQVMATENYSYPVTAEQLQHVRLLIDAPSTALTQATFMLEGILSGESRLVLHVRPSAIRERLMQFEGVAEVALWEVPLQAEQAILTRLADPELRGQFQQERWLYDTQTPFSQARLLQLQCIFEDKVQQPGARRLFLDLRIMQRQFQRATRRQQMDMLEASGIQLPRDTQAQQFYLDQVAASAILWRELANFNLGVIALEAEEYESALFYQEHTLEEFPDTRYRHAAFYGIGRSYEALARQQDDASLRQQAVKYYVDDDDVLSPFRRGNSLRAARLAQPAETVGEDNTAAAD